MKVLSVTPKFYNTNLSYSTKVNKNPNTNSTSSNSIAYNYYSPNVRFGEFFDPNRTVPHIDYEEYCAMSEATKRRFRKKYNNFDKDKSINKEQLFNKESKRMPLKTEHLMDEFIKTAKIYNKYKEQPIICLGRSPKWFLNAALWMKDGIDDYKFVAFSKFWYLPDYRDGIRRVEGAAPTEEEITAYRKYLKRIKADPQTIVNHMKKTGQKTVITDYLNSGKGASSFMEVMGNYAKDLGILEEFSKSIQIVGIGSMRYMEKFSHDDEEVLTPKVYMPKVLWPYERNIKQEFYDMNYDMFEEMLINENTNECRSTYYPHGAWTLYKPDKFKTGMVNDLKKIEGMVKKLKGKDSMASFSPAMCDFRNLLNFRILDALNSRKILKAVHKSKV